MMMYFNKKVNQEFCAADTDKDGKLSYDEAFAVAEKLVGEELDREVFSNAFKLADINGNGTLQLYEFSQWFYQIDNSESLSERRRVRLKVAVILNLCWLVVGVVVFKHSEG